MKLAVTLLSLLSTVGFGQSKDQLFDSSVRLLTVNHLPAVQFYGGTKREMAYLDTLSATEDNDRFKTYRYTWRNDYEQTAAWLEKTTARFPRQHGLAGEIYLNHLRDYNSAIRHFDAYDALTPSFDDVIGYSPVSYLKGLAWRELGDHQKAVALFSKAIDSLAIKHGPEWVNYKQYVSRAVSYIALQEPEKALVDLERANKNFTRSAIVQYYKGQALLLLDRVVEARSSFQEASFFVKALRAERDGDYVEDNANPLYESAIDEVLARLKTHRH